MGKKELKRDLKLCESDLNSMADEAIYYKERALKAEAIVEKLIEAGNDKGWAWVRKQKVWIGLVDEWRANPPKDYREAKE